MCALEIGSGTHIARSVFFDQFPVVPHTEGDNAVDGAGHLAVLAVVVKGSGSGALGGLGEPVLRVVGVSPAVVGYEISLATIGDPRPSQLVHVIKGLIHPV